MASFFNIRAFGRNPNKNNSVQPPKLANSPVSPSQSSVPLIPPLSHTPALAAGPVPEPAFTDDREATMNTRRTPFFFREENSNLVVKGNLVTLAAKPEYVEKAEWLAHQVVEQFRTLTAMMNVIQEKNEKTGVPICNQRTCPTMSAGGHTYTWLDSNRVPQKIPAPDYFHLVQRWILGRINDPNQFPTDPTIFSSSSTFSSPGPSTPGDTTPIPAGPTNLQAPLSVLSRDWLGKSGGFPENFERDIKMLYQQMFRCYAHIYWSHWVDPFYHLSATSQLNTCFIHFINVGKFFQLLTDRDVEPMQPLIDIWVNRGLLPGATTPTPTPVNATTPAPITSTA